MRLETRFFPPARRFGLLLLLLLGPGDAGLGRELFFFPPRSAPQGQPSTPPPPRAVLLIAPRAFCPGQPRPRGDSALFLPSSGSGSGGGDPRSHPVGPCWAHPFVARALATPGAVRGPPGVCPELASPPLSLFWMSARPASVFPGQNAKEVRAKEKGFGGSWEERKLGASASVF